MLNIQLCTSYIWSVFKNTRHVHYIAWLNSSMFIPGPMISRTNGTALHRTYIIHCLSITTGTCQYSQLWYISLSRQRYLRISFVQIRFPCRIPGSLPTPLFLLNIQHSVCSVYTIHCLCTGYSSILTFLPPAMYTDNETCCELVVKLSHRQL